MFVKPARGGSSIGITKVSDLAGLPVAVEDAMRCDPKVLVEAAVPGREIECGILEDSAGRPEASVPAEVRVVGDYEFYDFEACRARPTPSRRRWRAGASPPASSGFRLWA